MSRCCLAVGVHVFFGGGGRRPSPIIIYIMNTENLFPYGEGFVKEVDNFPLHLFTVSFHLNSGGMYMILLLKCTSWGFIFFGFIYKSVGAFFWG